jgi:hypothetical protein
LSEIVDLFVPLDALDEPLKARAARALGWPVEAVAAARVLRRSLDARKRRQLGYRLRVEVTGHGTRRAAADKAPSIPSRAIRHWPTGLAPPRVVIVGSGPAGTWAALRLAEAGVPCTIIERGKPVQPRRRDLALAQRGKLNPESNYCFGEGGAGTYSDGKLYTRARDRQGVAGVLGELARFGAPADILVDARPHVGSNLLPRVLVALREHLEGLGVRYLFDTEVTGLRTRHQRVYAVQTRDGGELPADAVVLAVGHSARGAYAWALRAGIALERKDLALGVRIEHPQRLIDTIQYGDAAGHPRLPPASYDLQADGGGRSLYSFCMCPGGWIVPSATEPEGVVVNGMSLSKRDSPFANAGFVVNVRASDFGSAAGGPLAGIDFQRSIENAAGAAAGGALRAPAQRLIDFLAGRVGGDLPKTSYRPGVVPVRMDDLFPDFVTTGLREGLRVIAARVRGFAHPEAVMVAAETRTSAPVRIVRDPVRLESPSVAGCFPAGEGAGYAGGIVSAGLDGCRVADAILARVW